MNIIEYSRSNIFVKVMTNVHVGLLVSKQFTITLLIPSLTSSYGCEEFLFMIMIKVV